MNALSVAAVGALLLWLVTVPLVQPWLMPGALEHDASRALQVPLLALSGLACMPLLAPLRRWRAAALVAGAGAVLSVLLAAQPAWALRELALFGGLAALALVVARQVPPRALHWSIAGGAALYAAVVVLLGALTYATGDGITREEIFLGYANRRLFNHVQTVAIPLCAIVAVVGASRVLRGLAWAGLALQTALLILCAGRATALALVVGALVAGLVARRPALRPWRPVLPAVAAGVALYLLLFQALPLLIGSQLPPNADFAVQRLGDDQARGRLWRQAAEALLAHPWFGVGPMHLAHAPAFNGTAAHPHDLYLQLAAEWGLPVTVSLGLLAWPWARRLWTTTRQAPTPEHAGLLLVAVAIAVDAAFSGSFVMPVSQVWIAVAVGWILRVCQPGPVAAVEQASTGVGVRSARLAAGLLCVLLPLWLAVMVGLEWDGRGGQHATTMHDFPAARMHPRFWTHGWFGV